MAATGFDAKFISLTQGLVQGSVSKIHLALKKMEALCRKFIWGKNDRGHDKLSLIVWDMVAKDKRDGGLATTSFDVQGKAMRLKQVLKIFSGAKEDWILVLQALVQHAAKKRPGGRSCEDWSAQEILLACCPKHIPKTQTTTGFSVRGMRLDLSSRLSLKNSY
ncbi:hypothetical protein R1sor_002715 [Riccia sorocarpa]|uniref:Uncharacterized protein n=1 Tax=Riccia sorocarpa TaxID=122646 RepID=A0ABD3GZJ3_9MARC